MMEISTLSIYKGYLNLLKNIGIFPYKLKFESQSFTSHNGNRFKSNNSENLDDSEIFQDFKQKLTSVSFHTRGRAAITHSAIIIFFYSYFVFQIGRFIQRATNGAPILELFGMSCWIWKPIFVGNFIAHFHFNLNSVAKFHSDWNNVESYIYRTWSLSIPLKVLEISKGIIRRKRYAMVYIPAWTIIIMVWMSLNHINSPEFSSYISSFIGNPLNAEEYYWLLYVSLIIQILALVPILLTFDHFYTLCITFSMSTSRILNLITSPFELGSSPIPERLWLDGEFQNGSAHLSLIQNKFIEKNIFSSKGIDLDHKNLNVVSKLRMAMQHYSILEKMVGQFNSVYRWMFFIYQGVIMINLCILIFVPLRFSKIFPWTSLMVFFISSAFFAFHLATVLPAMGAVLTKSSEFKGTWMRLMPQIASTQDINTQDYLTIMAELESCIPFGFQVGSFYTVTSGSMLNFFSITTSYLIVLLQLEFQ